MRTFLFLLCAAFCASAQVPVPNIPPRTNASHELSWAASPTPNVTYILRRGIVPGIWQEMVEVKGLSYIWTNAPARLTNYYVLAAKDSFAEEGELSNVLKVEPRPRPITPELKTAVPVTVEIYRREPGQLWAKAITVGPFYDRADRPAEEFSAVMKIGPPIQLLPD